MSRAPECPPDTSPSWTCLQTPPSIGQVSGGGNSLDLLPMVFSRPKDAVAAARNLLAGSPNPFDASVAFQVIGIFERDFGDAAESIAMLRRARGLALRSNSTDRVADVSA